MLPGSRPWGRASPVSTSSPPARSSCGEGPDARAVRALRGAEADFLGSVAVIDRAQIAEPSLLRPNLLLALGLCVALATGAAYFAEPLDPRFIIPADVESL